MLVLSESLAVSFLISEDAPLKGEPCECPNALSYRELPYSRPNRVVVMPSGGLRVPVGGAGGEIT